MMCTFFSLIGTVIVHCAKNMFWEVASPECAIRMCDQTSQTKEAEISGKKRGEDTSNSCDDKREKQKTIF